MNTYKKMKIVAEATRVYLELDADAHQDEPQNETPIIYMDESLYVDWQEEGDESFWHSTKTMFEFKFSDTQEHEIKDKVFDGIENYLDRKEILSR